MALGSTLTGKIKQTKPPTGRSAKEKKSQPKFTQLFLLGQRFSPNAKKAPGKNSAFPRRQPRPMPGFWLWLGWCRLAGQPSVAAWPCCLWVRDRRPCGLSKWERHWSQSDTCSLKRQNKNTVTWSAGFCRLFKFYGMAPHLQMFLMKMLTLEASGAPPQSILKTTRSAWNHQKSGVKPPKSTTKPLEPHGNHTSQPQKTSKTTLLF